MFESNCNLMFSEKSNCNVIEKFEVLAIVIKQIQIIDPTLILSSCCSCSAICHGRINEHCVYARTKRFCIRRTISISQVSMILLTIEEKEHTHQFQYKQPTTTHYCNSKMIPWALG